MVMLPFEQQASFASLCRDIGSDIDLGVVALSHQERKRYWQFWCAWIEPFHHVDPMLTGLRNDKRQTLLCGFARRVRTGTYNARNNYKPVWHATVQVALRAIGTTFELDAKPNPLYHSEGQYWKGLERLIESYR